MADAPSVDRSVGYSKVADLDSIRLSTRRLRLVDDLFANLGATGSL
jgi:hypothetical protein